MTLEALYFVASIAAALGVIASLIFVGFQLRQGQLIARADSQRDILKQAIELHLRTSENSEAFESIRQCIQEFDRAPMDKKKDFNSWAWNLLLVFEQSIYMFRDGLMNEGSFVRFEGAVLSMINTPGGRQWWESMKDVVGKDVGEHLMKRDSTDGTLVFSFYDVFPHLGPDEASSSN